ncbi:hypothetical protein PV326_000540, partial [Microctonus aethiopoides]
MFRVPKTMPAISSSSSSSTSSTSVASTSSISTNAAMTKRLKMSQKCSYNSYDCSQSCIEGYSYCMKHILSDPIAPYKQCAFIYNTNGRKCTNPAPKLDRRDATYCSEHTRKAQIARIKSTSRHTLSETPETLLLNLSHYTTKSINSDGHKESNDKSLIKALDPFSDIDAFRVNASGCNILDYASSSDSDVEPTVSSEALRGAFLDDSDNESIHNSQEDPL